MVDQNLVDQERAYRPYCCWQLVMHRCRALPCSLPHCFWVQLLTALTATCLPKKLQPLSSRQTPTSRTGFAQDRNSGTAPSAVRRDLCDEAGARR